MTPRSSQRRAFLLAVSAVLSASVCGASGEALAASRAAARSPTVAVARAPMGSLELRVRDSATGRALRAHVLIDGGHALQTDDTGRERLDLATGDHWLRVEVPGHQPLENHFAANPRETLPVTFWLDPETAPREIAPESIQSRLKVGYTLLHGHVIDADTGTPLTGVTVRAEGAKVQVTTDAAGYFSMQVRARKAGFAAGQVGAGSPLPETETLFIDAPGFKTHVISSTFLHDGIDTHFIVDLERGEGQTGRDDTHKLLHDLADDGSLAPKRPSEDEKPQGCLIPNTESADLEDVPGLVATVTVPTSIRVGTSCSGSSCSGVSTMSMDTYVSNGLNDEWIASWAANSLNAGAVAYRSYGSYYVAHPYSSSYDICSTTSCQVYDSDGSSATTTANKTTTGVVLSSDSKTAYRSEYAAENNGCYCSDGYTGSPSASWPCLSDSVCKGSSCNGHGRGMCQWGTERWATNGKDWNWILNHYYNNNGNPSGARSAYPTGSGSSTTTTAITNPFGWGFFYEKKERVVYRSTSDNHLWLMSAPSAGGTWTKTDISSKSGAPAAAGIAHGYGFNYMDSDHVVYRGSDSKIHEIWYNGSAWAASDLSAATGATTAAADPFGFVNAFDNSEHVYYRGTDSHIHELVWLNSKWTHNDVSSLSSAPAASGNPMGYAFSNKYSQHVFYRSSDSHIHELYSNGKSWVHTDLTAKTGATAAAGDPYGFINLYAQTQHVFYRATDNYIHEFSNAGSWVHYPMSNVAGVVTASGDPAGYSFSSQYSIHCLYRSSDNHIHEIYNVGSGWASADLNSTTGAPAAAGNPAGFVTFDNSYQHVVYRTSDNRVIELLWNGKWSYIDLTAKTK